ncbi:hypothetical protein ACEPAH_9445 [Sanghuangporus vaninii]
MMESEESAPRVANGPLQNGPNEQDLEKCEPSKATSLKKKPLHLRLQIPRKHRPSHGFLNLKHLLARLDKSWILNNMDASHLKPIIRTAVCAWVCVILLVASKTQVVMGQSSFLVLIAAFLSPPAEPFIAVLEREISNLIFVTVSFAWCCLGIFLCILARKERDELATQHEIFTGRYIEARETIICAVFLFLGTAALLYSRARIAQGPYVLGPTLGCIVIDITLSVAHFYPYQSYQTAISCVLPFAFHSAVAIACSALVFPETVNAQFIKRFRGVFVPLSKAMHTQSDIFNKVITEGDFSSEEFIKLVSQAEAALAPLAASSRLIKKDFSWGRFGPNDFSRLHEFVRHMTVRANGMAFYFKVIGSETGGPALSLLNTPWSTPTQSRPATRPSSPAEMFRDDPTPSTASVKSTGRRKVLHHHRVASLSSPRPILRRHHSHQQVHHHHLNHRHLHHSHHHTSRPASVLSSGASSFFEKPVGIFESQRYVNIESRFSHPASEELFLIITARLADGSRDLIVACGDTLDHVISWLERMNQDRFWKLYGRGHKHWQEAIRDDELAMSKLQYTLDEFWNEKRHLVLELYRSADDADEAGSSFDDANAPHLLLYQCYLYQYHLMRFSKHLRQFLDEMIKLDRTRRRARIWIPVLPFRQIFLWKKWEPIDSSLQRDEDEDPDIVQGIDPENQSLLGVPTGRDPDALSPRTRMQAFGSMAYHTLSALGSGNAVFGLKAGVLSIILSLPTYVRSSAEFTYIHRSVWALIYGQLTLSRFRGDTAFAWISRVFSTFMGCVVGMVMWYISTGSGNGNPYGLASVSAVCFPVLFFFRYYFPASPMTLTIFLLSIGLVIGFSWQDTHDPSPSTAGKGFSVAWTRFLLVTIGVAVAFILSYLPPTATLRKYLRATYATTVDQLGASYCDVVSFATAPEGPHKEIINKDLIAIRMKLRRAASLKKNITYEFSLRGKWPEKRYDIINEIQIEISYLLSHLRSVTEHLELPWAQAFLKRTLLLEPDFQGDVLGIISMISFALRTGKSLPQVTPCPLLDRYTAHHHGLNVLSKEEATELSISTSLTIETLQDEQYLFFSVGVATVFMIITRIDRLMMATKELVGEQYHIHGLPVYRQKSREAQ